MLTDPDVVRVLLARLIAARCPMHVFVEGSDTRYATLLLEIDAALGALIVDELHPRAGHDRLRVGAALRFAGRLDGIEIRFRAALRAIDDDAAIAAYMVDLPRALDYREHRDLRRARAPGVVAELRSTADGTVPARVLDLSASGIRLAVAAPHPIAADTRWNCALMLPNGIVDASISILRVRRSGARFGTPAEDCVGARFGTLSALASRRIGHFMADSERAWLRARRASRRSVS